MAIADPNPPPPAPHRVAILPPRPLWIGLTAVVLSLTVAVAGEQVSDESDENARLAERQAKIDDATVYGWIFGPNISDAVAARQQLDTILRQKIAVVDRVCGLTDAQRPKLQLAG
jgi:hypothetical protein